MKVSGFGKNLLIFLAADRSSNDCQTFQFNVQFRLLPYSCASFPNVLTLLVLDITRASLFLEPPNSNGQIRATALCFFDLREC